MSILIMGMKMPKDCTECRFAFDGRCFANMGRKTKIDVTNYCPLIELPPHGRLIDGDVAEVITYTNESGDFADGILYAADWIASQPTILEAEADE